MQRNEGKMAGKGTTVLIVDDQGELRSMIKKMLRQMDFFELYVEARDGEEAWERLLAQPFELVICDLDMPRLDGIGLLKRCQLDPALRNVPFLIISGDRQAGSVATAVELGAYNYIVKPFSFNTLKQSVQEIFDRLNSSEEIQFRKAEGLKDQRRFAEALQILSAMERSGQPLKPKWLNLKGEVLRGMEEMEQASECFKRTIKSSELFLAAYKNYASVQEELGHRDEAIRALLKADEISPRDSDRKVSLGKLLLEEGRTDEGKAFLKKAVRQTSEQDKKTMQLKVAEAYLAAECFEEAEMLFSNALESDPQELHLYNRLGIALRRQGKYAEAERYYHQALKIYPDNPIIFYNLGVLFVQTKELLKAIQFFEKALQIDPNFKEAQDMLAEVHTAV
jgi:tetratricopeptide (TPR) repeat protein